MASRLNCSTLQYKVFAVLTIIIALYILVNSRAYSVEQGCAPCGTIDETKADIKSSGQYPSAGKRNLTHRTNPSQLDHPNFRECGFTFFTTAPANSRRPGVFQNTIDNWPFLKKWNVTIIIFTDDKDLCTRSKRAGWICSPILRTAGSDNRPILPTMFLKAMLLRRGCLYGYANGDMLFDETLVSSLEAVLSENMFKSAVKKDPLLITGIRYRVTNVTSADASNLHALGKKLKQTGVRDSVWAGDFFITSNNYPWITMPDIVIGLASYDNFLVVYSNQFTNWTVDLSETVVAYHQSMPTDDLDRRRKDDRYNVNLIKKTFGGFQDAGGRIICTYYFSKRDSYNRVSFAYRRRDLLCETPLV